MAARAIGRVNPQSTALFVCDLQDKFRNGIKYFPEIVTTSKRLVDTARILGMKTVVTEHYPKGLGPTVAELGIDRNAVHFYEKTKFSMCVPDVEPILANLKSVIIVGIEAHVCVLQTTYDLIEKGIDVHVVADAVSSRSHADRKYAFKQMQIAGANLTTSECVILGLLKDAAHPKFRDVQKLIMTSAPDSGLVHDPTRFKL